MSKKITHEQARVALSKLRITSVGDWGFELNNKEAHLRLADYINQQEKQWKLLVLYKRFFDKLDLELRIDTFSVNGERLEQEILVTNFEETYFNSEDIISLFKQIKELEDDL